MRSRFTTRSKFTTCSPWSHKPVSLKRAPRQLQNGRVQGNPPTPCQPFANPSPTFCQPFLPTLRQPFANLFCQPLSNPLFPWTPGTRLETRVNGFLGSIFSTAGSFEKIGIVCNGAGPWNLVGPADWPKIGYLADFSQRGQQNTKSNYIFIGPDSGNSPRGPKPRESLKKGFPGLPARPGKVEKVPKTSPKSVAGTFLRLRAGTPGETF